MAVEELYAIAAAMRAEAGGLLARDVAQQLRKGRAPIHNAMVTSVLAKLPHRGGLGVWASEAKFSYRVRGKRDIIAAVKVSRSGLGIDDMQGLDNGRVIHPFYGRRPWFSQVVPSGTVSNPIREEGGHQLELSAVVGIENAVIRIITA